MSHERGESHDLIRLCHDLRQFVATGLLLSSGAVAADPQREDHVRLATIHTLFEQIRLLIDAEVGEGPRRSRIDLAEVVGDCVRVAHRADIQIRARVAPGATAFGDPVLLRRAVANVLDNAVRAAGDHGSIRVAVSVRGDDSVVTVADDGVGFGRGPHGTGYGMSVVALAIEACGGRLEIHSGPAAGTTVRLVLPRDGMVP